MGGRGSRTAAIRKAREKKHLLTRFFVQQRESQTGPGIRPAVPRRCDYLNGVGHDLTASISSREKSGQRVI